MVFHATLESPLGDILLCAEASRLCGLYFVGEPDCPVAPGLPRPRRRAARPSEGSVDGQPIRNLKVCQPEPGNPPSAQLAHRHPLPVSLPTPKAGALRLLEADTPTAVKTLFHAVQMQLDGYFAGHRKVFDLPLAMHGTAFQKRIWDALLTIPYGTVVSYGDVACTAGFTSRYGRPAGAAVGCNPITIVVPCHRVVASSHALTGYTGGLRRKLALLELEGLALH